MKKLKLFYNEAKDQAVPFALPALRSYKQNLLFPEDRQRKIDQSLYPISDSTENSRSPSKQKSIRSSTRNRRVSPPRLQTTTPLRPMAANRNIQKNPSVHSNPPKKPFLDSRSSEPIRPIRQSNSKPSSSLPKPSAVRNIETPKNTGKPIGSSQIGGKPLNSPKNEIKPRIRATSTPRNPPSRSLENTSEALNSRAKPESAKSPIRNFMSTPKHALPMTSIPEKKRSTSISSSKSIRSHLKSPRLNSSNSRKENAFPIPEYPSKNPSRQSAARSLSRKRPKKNGKKSSYFDFDPLHFRMSDLSIYPLF